MTIDNYMHFFVENVHPEDVVVNACSKATGLTLESEGYSLADSIGFVQILKYEEGFRMGVCILWPLTYEFRRRQEEVAARLAAELQSRILFDVEDSELASKERWILVEPDETSRAVQVEEGGQGVALKAT